MKQLILIIAGVLAGATQIVSLVINGYSWERDYFQQWELADKASTIPAKKDKITAFLQALESGYAAGHLASHNAIFLTQPNNELAANLTALRTLKDRLEQIQGMSPSSFEYNTAIQQITAQEQGEAKKMLDVFEGCWFLANHPFNWSWISILVALGWLLLIFYGGIWWMAEN